MPETGSLGGCRFGIFAWTPTRTLTRDDHAAFEDLPTPNAPRLAPVQRRGQTLPPDGAIGAQRLGALQVDGAFGEPQVGIADMTWHGR